MLLTTPSLGPMKVNLRPYQEEAISAIRAEFARGKKSTLLVLPTGTGKTVTFGAIARRTIERGNRVLVLAHRGELIEQAANTFDLLGIEAGIEKAESRARALYEPDCVIATVQTMQGKRLESWPRDHFKLIIRDEAHHSTADSDQAIYRHFRGARLLGVTATADRADKTSVFDVYESLAYELELWDAMTAPPPGPYLSRMQVIKCEVGIDLRGLKTTGGDFNIEDLKQRIRPLVGTIANATRQEIGERQTLVFTPDVGSAEAMATALASMDTEFESSGIKAQWISGDDPRRKEKLQDYRERNIQVLCSCALLTEGVDLPITSAIVLCRPTKSRALYAQMVGRGLRLAKGKDKCLVVDFGGLTDDHDLVTILDVFSGRRLSDETIEIAKAAMKANPRKDLVEAIEDAERLHKERQSFQIRVRKQDVKYRRVSYDPAAVHETLGFAWKGGSSHDAGWSRSTPGQIEALTKFKVDNPETLSKTKASTLLDYLVGRSKAGLASHRQVASLIANGVDPGQARQMTFEDASGTLNKLFARTA